MSVATIGRPAHFAGLPLGAWAFALRNWAAVMLALAVAFWLQLDGAASAGTCVAILSLQTRGQAFQKSIYRLGGTAIGVLASIAIAGTFNETRYLFLAACCAWFGVCAILAGLLDGNRAYGAVLSGYTVAIVALPNVDAPVNTFASGINQGAAITVGILAVAVVNDLLLAPNLFPTVLARLQATHRKVTAFAIVALRSGASPDEAAALLKEITALHGDVTALAAESPSGRARYQAACLAMNGMLRTVSAVRIVAAALASLGETGREPRDNLVRALAGQDHQSVRHRAIDVMAIADASSARLIAAAACLVLLEQHSEAAAALAAMKTGRRPDRATHLSPYKSRPAALRNGLRAAIVLAASTLLLSWLDWPAATTALVQIGTLVGLSATNQNPRGFALAALVTVPLAVAVTGVTEFLVLDGVDEFELLALAAGPVIVAASLLLASGKPALYGIGFLLLVFFTVLLSPANPQTYNPQTYLYASFLSVLAAIALFVLLSTVLPISDAQRGHWLLTSARDDLRRALSGRRRHFVLPACAFRDADRIGQFAGLHLAGDRDGDLVTLIRMSDLAACARRIRTTLGGDRQLRPMAERAGAVLPSPDVACLRALGRELLLCSHNASDRRGGPLRWAAVDLLFAATLIELSPGLLADIATGTSS